MPAGSPSMDEPSRVLKNRPTVKKKSTVVISTSRHRVIQIRVSSQKIGITQDGLLLSADVRISKTVLHEWSQKLHNFVLEADDVCLF